MQLFYLRILCRKKSGCVGSGLGIVVAKVMPNNVITKEVLHENCWDFRTMGVRCILLKSSVLFVICQENNSLCQEILINSAVIVVSENNGPTIHLHDTACQTPVDDWRGLPAVQWVFSTINVSIQLAPPFVYKEQIIST